MPLDVSSLGWFIYLKKYISHISPDERDRYSHGGEYSVKMELYTKVLT